MPELTDHPPCSLAQVEAVTLKMVESSPDAMLACGKDGKVLIFNHAAEAMFEMHRSEILGKPVEELLPDAVRVVHVNHRAGFFAEPRTREMGAGRVLMARKRGGDEFPVTIHLSYFTVPEFGNVAMAVVRRASKGGSGEH